MSQSLSDALQGQPGYRAFLQDIKDRIRRAQIGAALAANRELILLHWDIGREILDRQRQEGWGAKVVDQLAVDLRRTFPELKGFSARNLKYMRAFSEAWPDREFVQQAVAQIPWGSLSPTPTWHSRPSRTPTSSTSSS